MQKLSIFAIFIIILNCSLSSFVVAKNDSKISNIINNDLVKINEFWKNTDIKLTEGTGFFDVAKDENGVWWFVTPDGYAFYSIGINCVIPDGRPEYKETVLKKYGDFYNWSKAQIDRFKNWSYNSLGEWSRFELFENMPFSYQIKTFGDAQFLISRKLPDIWNPAWREMVRSEVENATDRFRDNPYFMGYYIDNEVNWGPDIFDKNTILEEFIASPSFHGKNTTINFLRYRYNDDIEEFNNVWNMKLNDFDDLFEVDDLGRHGWIAQHSFRNIKVKQDIKAFNKFYAEEYFNYTASLIRKHDPNHLILGVRYHAWGTPKEVIEACGRYCDVISVNYYRFNRYVPYEFWKFIQCYIYGSVPLDNWMKRYSELSEDKPILITEFGFAARDSGQSQRMGAALLLPTQRQRANHFSWYVNHCLRIPYIIGYHWFSFNDKIKKDVDTNVGVVNIYDEEYTLLVNSMAKMNSQAYDIHKECVS
jgi:agarase